MSLMSWNEFRNFCAKFREVAFAPDVKDLDTPLGCAEAEYEVSEPSTALSPDAVDSARPVHPTPCGAGHPQRSIDDLVFDQDVKIEVLEGAMARACDEIVRLYGRVAELEEELAWKLNSERT